MPQFYNRTNLNFLLFELLKVQDLTSFPYFQDHDQETFSMVLDAADRLSRENLYPLLTEMDRQPPRMEEDRIKVHPGMKNLMKLYGEGGWIPATFSYEEGGQQLPQVISQSAMFIMAAANYSASVYPYLTTGAANLIRTFASEELKAQFLPAMLAGRWQGTMALTEPDAGSSLSDISSLAVPAEDGSYRLSGQKIYISCGDHDATENVVHLLLARIEGAPLGTRGISLFVVPRLRTENGELVFNDVTTAGLYHKMGYHGAPIAHLMLGENQDCHGYLVGKPHHGLSYMFQMMNEARVGVGLTAASIASAAYYASLEYAKTRPQGRPPSAKDPSQAQVPIIEHADVRRMLLFQKAIIEGSLSLLLQCSLYADMAHTGNGEEQEKAALLLDLLTPIAKSYPAEMGCQTTSAAVQILGGAGYLQDFPVEQYFREARIHPIHEGTTGIHGLDLLGRKIMMNDTRLFELYMEEVRKAIVAAQTHDKLSPYADKLETYLNRLRGITVLLITVAHKERPEAFLADATLYLELFGLVAISWQWLLQGTAAQMAIDKGAEGEMARFYNSKLATMKYYFEYELVKSESLIIRLKSSDRISLETQPDLLL